MQKITLQVATGFSGVPDEVLIRASGYKSLGIFVNKKISPGQVEILKVGKLVMQAYQY